MHQQNLHKTPLSNTGKPLAGQVAFFIDENGNAQLRDENNEIKQITDSSQLSDYVLNAQLISALELYAKFSDLNKKQSLGISTAYEINPETTPEVIFADSSSGYIEITVPSHSALPDDGKVHCWYIAKSNIGSEVVRVQLTNPNTFPQGHNYIDLIYPGEAVYFGGIKGLGWFSITSLKIVCQANRLTTWNATNFVNPTAIPFGNAVVNDNQDIIEFNTAFPTRLTVKVKTRVVASYHWTIDSTGGSGRYNIVAYLRKNGNEIIQGSESRAGDGANEDCEGGHANVNIEMNPNDYIEVVIDHSLLTGQLYFCDFQLETIL